jgi:hypothetical protein
VAGDVSFNWVISPLGPLLWLADVWPEMCLRFVAGVLVVLSLLSVAAAKVDGIGCHPSGGSSLLC